MKLLAASLPFLVRELQATLASRILLLVPFAGLVAGSLAAALYPREEIPIAAPLFLLQVILYAIPLAAILTATGSAHSETGESLLLASLPIPAFARPLGKFAALLAAFVLASAFALLPPLLFGLPFGAASLLFGYSAGAASLFLALGLLLGFAFSDGIKAHLLSLALWLALTVGASAMGYLLLVPAGAAVSAELWAGLMMLSPLDALRVGILFSVESVPFETATLPALPRWWLAHPGVWFALLSSLLTAGALALSSRASRR